MKIGLYGGTFDPIHHGHLILARTAMEQLGLEKIIFIPAAISPHKLGTEPTPATLRWEMLLAAIDGEPGFAADDIELRRTGPSYTYDTVAEYRERNLGPIHYLIGHDHLSALASWHRIEELREMVTFVVLDRGENVVASPFPRISRRLDISSSEIRERVANGRSIRYSLPEAVAEIIRQNHLYEAPAN